MTEHKSDFKAAPTGWVSKLARRALLATPQGKAHYEKLTLAAKEGDEAQARRLLPLVGAWGWARGDFSPLAWAAAGGHAGCVEALLPASDIARSDKRGQTSALMLAAHAGSARCVELLLPYSDPLARDDREYSALIAAAMEPKGAECVKLLAPHSDCGATDRAGLSSLHHAANRGNAACVAALLPRSDPNASRGRRRTPLMRAALAGSLECVELLLGVSPVDHVDDDGWSALEIAKNDGMSDIVRLIEGWKSARAEREGLSEAVPAAGERSPRAGARL